MEAMLQLVPHAWRNLLNTNAHTITVPLNNMQSFNSRAQLTNTFFRYCKSNVWRLLPASGYCQTRGNQCSDNIVETWEEPWNVWLTVAMLLKGAVIVKKLSLIVTQYISLPTFHQATVTGMILSGLSKTNQTYPRTSEDSNRMFEIFSSPIPQIYFAETKFIPITLNLKMGEMYLPVIYVNCWYYFTLVNSYYRCKSQI